MKIGDKLYCYNNSINHIFLGCDFTKDKYYHIRSIGSMSISILDNNNIRCDFSLIDEKLNFYSYKRWFATEQELRKIKLYRLI